MIDREKLEDVADILQSVSSLWKTYRGLLSDLGEPMVGGAGVAEAALYGVDKALEGLHEALTGKPEDQGSIRLQHDIYDAKQYREGIRAAYDTFNHLNTIITDRLGTQIQGYEAQGADVYGNMAFLKRMQALVRAAGQSLDKLLE